MLSGTRMERYRHTQVGYLILSAMSVVIVLIAVLLAVNGLNWIAVAVLVIIIAALVMFSTLTVTIGAAEIEVRFGPGPFRKRFALDDVVSCHAVRNSWWYGWGMRLTPHGWLYNVSGLDAVEIEFRTGKKVRIGTDVPLELEQAIGRALSEG